MCNYTSFYDKEYFKDTTLGIKKLEFNVNLITAFKVDVKVAPNYVTENGGNVGGKNGGDNVPSSSQVVPSSTCSD